MVRLDIAYVNNFSLWLDLKILFKTIWVVLTAKGAY
jgi:lipopolysaccharide/colanic/teichoic acid biosynthesis glycosyltransferase